ncbi:MAG: ATP-binding cassette domain-containing protein [Candidatus Aminicenantes bacterium]|nr:ATP-binding cassette domain-containing protein [Candidatus Aminicenantes bacterium]
MRQRVIEVRNLNFTYPDGTTALKDMCLELYNGETIGLIGPNGAGKSTAILHLNGVLKGVGKIKLLGKEINKKNIREIRSKVGIVFQDPNDQLFMPTVFDDIAFGPLNLGLSVDVVKSKTLKVLSEMGLDGVKDKPSHHLSLGEKKSVSLATVMVMEPAILILDEPTNSLDPGTRRIFIQMLSNLKVSKIIATHDLDLVFELCSRVVLMDNGRVITEGETKEILSNKILLEEHNLEIPASLLLKENIFSVKKSSMRNLI